MTPARVLVIVAATLVMVAVTALAWCVRVVNEPWARLGA